MSAIRWFKDSPDAGDPACICSWCGERITEDEAPVLRMFNIVNEEARFHNRCAGPALYGAELIPRPKETRHE